ncbi:phage tail-like protein [Parabacteroides sp. PFB2-10]|uniref:phage tail protein n=1 Tax=Parabacteroides sp. PFB2-10 TaxID=1742405 RepID=UPI002474ADD6|nr:phage tail protein [Parabacteroides sp. PFB2-10]MDH6313652.1 phage tail-like protein [Parabacteroides sp. PFB2-10]MDL2244719.1 phage tail protein [Parabacteroides sp. OttesenSCG-928-J18]
MASSGSSGKDAAWTPPVAFYFKVTFHGDPAIPDTNFKEVSGLTVDMDVETVKEGGENNFTHQLPLRLKHNRLVLKRALENMDNALEKWVKDNLENGFSIGFTPRNITITLLDNKGEPFSQWLCNNAYPAKWDLNTLDAEKNALAIETLELNYNLLSRTK